MAWLKKLVHTVYECKYHVVWLPKYRYRVMTGDVRACVNSTIRRLCDWKKLEILEMNVMTEHLHIILEIAPNTNVDAVSGATTTSKALLMAIYNALEPNHDRVKNKKK